jgi:hypothetical protein
VTHFPSIGPFSYLACKNTQGWSRASRNAGKFMAFKGSVIRFSSYHFNYATSHR